MKYSLSLHNAIIVLVIGYGQLIVSHISDTELETWFSCTNKLGTGSSHPGKSCRDIYNYNMASRGQSGYYWIETDKVYKVYCDMSLTCGGITGGWMRIANVDTSQGDDCPSGWNKIIEPKPLCRGSSNDGGCYSAYFSNNKSKYNFICGKLRGYQKGTTDAFSADFSPSYSIDAPYLDGVSITVGNPRKNVWSYAVGYSQLYNYEPHGFVVNCPCAKIPGADPPVYVEEHYYCESGSNSYALSDKIYVSDSLWDGSDCPAGDECCSTLGPPWFYRQFTESEKGDVEVRICCDQHYNNEATLLDQVQLYIQ